MRAALLLVCAPCAVALAAPRIFFDLGVHGRVEVALTAYDTLPRLVENVRLIASNERAPECTFDGATIGGGGDPWEHGFRAETPAIARGLLETDVAAPAAVEAFGARYYHGADCGDGDVALTTPLSGDAAFGAAYAFARLAAAPADRKRTLLEGVAVLGVCASPGADDVLASVVSAGGATVAATGIVADPGEDCLVPAPAELPDDDCIWDATQEREWRERRFLRVEKEGFRDPARGNSGTVR